LLVLSFAQQRLWFLDQLEPGNPAYNLPIAYLITGQVNLWALRQSLNEIVRRHEVLRTTFIAKHGQPVQVIASETCIDCPEIDLRTFPAPERRIEAERLARAEAQQPFNLAEGPLLRAKLLRLDHRESVFLLTIHHIIADSWTLRVFMRELQTLYDAFSRQGNTGSPLPELPIQYADFALCQRQWLRGEILEAHLAYWQQQLGGPLPVVQLPMARPRPPVRTYRGGKQSLRLRRELTAALQELSDREGVTLYTTLLAAFKTLLCRYTGLEDIIVGSPIAGWQSGDLEGLIGCFVNTVALRTDLSGNPGFRALLRRVREVTLGAYAHQELPFEKLLDALQPERDPSRSPLFQVLFVLQNAPLPKLDCRGLRLTPFEVDTGTTQFDLTLTLTETAQELTATLIYNTDLYTAAMATRMLAHFQTVLESIVANPGLPLSDLSLLTAPERHQILVEWNQTCMEYPQEVCIYQLFEAQVERTPDAVAVTCADQHLTYRVLNRQANQLAHYLRQLGVGPETLVGLCVDRSLAMVLGLLGILKAGGAYVPLDPAYPQERLAFICQDAHVSVLVTQHPLLGKFPALTAPVICLDTDGDPIAHQAPENPLGATTPAHLAYIIYTSGSTGRPKGVAIAHRSTVALLAWARDTFAPEELTGVLAATSICFDLSVFEVFVPLSWGGRVILADTVLQLPALPAATAVTLVNTVPSALGELLRGASLPAPVRTVNLAGEPLPTTLVQQICQQTRVERIYDLYGPSEDTTYSTYARRRSDGPATIGRPIANTQIYVLDHHMRPVPVGIPGELYIGGAGLARGYLGRPEVTAARFLPHPFRAEAGARLYQTGDLVRYRPDGRLEFLGRRDHQVKVRGFRIELGEIETVLRQHPMVQEAVVLAREDRPDDKRLVAYVVPKQEQAPTVSILQPFLRQKLPAYMVPSMFIMLAALPLTPNGKIDRQAFPAPDHLRPALADTFVASRSLIEAALAGFWAEVLRLKQVGVHDNFFALGGHSLLATQVISRIRSTLQVELPLRCLFEAPTVAALAQCIETARQQGQQGQTPPLHPLPRAGSLPLSFTQERLWFLDQLAPGTATYNIPAAFRLTGRLDIAALGQSLNAIVQRHEVLRTTFRAIEGQPVQVIASPLTLPLPVVEIYGEAAPIRQATLLRLATEEARQPFDLARGPLIRTTLLRLGEEEHVLLLTMHHIVSDGWSMGVFFQELAALYTTCLANSPASLSALPIQYADFAQWQRQCFQEGLLETQLAYWRQQLAGLLPLDLPTDHPRPRLQTYRGTKQSLGLPPHTTEALKALSRQEGVTLFMTLLAAFQTLLYRYTGQEDVVVGCPIANRNRTEVEGLIGAFINTLALRTDLGGNPSFQDVLARVRDVALGAYAHQDIPIEKLIEELQPERDTSRPPLVQVLFNLLNFTDDRLALPHLTLTRLEVDEATAKFDLTLYVAETDAGLSVTANYNSDLFEATTIRQLLGHFQTLLEGIVANPARHISSIPLLTDAERQHLAHRRQRVRPTNIFVDFSTDDLEQSLPDRFVKQVQQYPQHVAVKTHQETWSYAALNRVANRITHAILTARGQGEERVALLFEHNALMIAGLLGVLKGGKTYVPLDPSYPRDRLVYMLEDAQAHVLLTNTRNLAFAKALMSDTQKILNVDDLPPGLPDNDPHLPTSPDTLAYILYTSGSTGQPKGVMQNHRNVLHHIRSYTNNLHISTQDRLTLFASYSFDAAVMDIFGALLNGATLYPVNIKEEPIEGIIRRCKEQDITIYHSTPTVYRYFVGSLRQADALPKLRLIVLGGEEVNSRDVALYKSAFSATCLFINGFGPTESTVTLQYFIDKQTEITRHTVPVGEPVADTEILLLDAMGEPATVVGEIAIRSPYIALGYWRQPALTQAAFLPDPAHGNRRVYRTGDMGRLKPDGTIEFVGRKDHQVKIRGYRIELGEIESVLAQHPAVQEVVVLAREDVPGERCLVAYAVPASGQTASPSILRNFLKQRLPAYMVPTAVVLLDALPLTPNGKINRLALPAPEQTRAELREGAVAPRTPVEACVADIWSQVLRLPRIGIHDNFFDLGGHSLLAVQVVSRIRQTLQVELPVRALFESPTLAELAVNITQSQLTARADDEAMRLLAEVEALSADDVQGQLTDASG
jgi:amino acid adenylation domain-containing protein